MSERLRITISVAEDQVDQIESVAAELARAGMTVERTLTSMGVITGSVDAAGFDALEAVHGVHRVEREGFIAIPQPDSRVQ